MALDRLGKLYGWGDGSYGCLGFGDNKRRATPCFLQGFDDRKVIDVACGDCFTCLITVTTTEILFQQDSE